VYTAGGFGSGAKQHNVAVCIADDADLDENVEWRRSDGSVTAGDTNTTLAARADASTDDAVGNDNENDDARRNARARSAALSALRTYEMPASVTTVAKNCDRFFDVGVRYHDPLDEWSDPLGVLVLAGDACHAMPPFLGQGANQALQDAWVLAEQLAAMRGGGKNTGEEKKAALRRYESIRKPPTTAIMLSSRVIGFVETGSGLVSNVRDAAFGMLGKLGIAGKIFLKNAVPVLK
jgi:2-polyprenyl-6-methoxyphenol hydroxylase-like FAD-dependent oxidoreductase